MTGPTSSGTSYQPTPSGRQQPGAPSAMGAGSEVFVSSSTTPSPSPVPVPRRACGESATHIATHIGIGRSTLYHALADDSKPEAAAAH
jgi:hypothetical protein